MNLALKDAVAKLYRPPANGIRQVLAVSRAVAERLPRIPTVAVISVTSFGRPPANLTGFERILRLSFEDVDFMSPDLSRRAREKLGSAFRPEHAEEILAFVRALPGEVVTVVVHCEGGYSRSCAIALALHKLYGYSADARHFAQANPSILRQMASTAPRS